jgi:hypothetical protein
MSKLRARLTYANVVATVAMFIALGGASYAAFNLPRNSVGTKQIKKNAVTSAKIKLGAVTGEDVKNGSLSASDFGQGQLPRGAEGPPGPKGDPGTPGATKDVIRYGPIRDLADGGEAESIATCQPAETVTGGGWSSLGAPANSNYIAEDWAAIKEGSGFATPANGSAATAWFAYLANHTGEPLSFRSYVFCASP